MATYVFLVSLTEKGKSHFEEIRKGGIGLSDTIKKLGGRSKGAFMTLGRFDIVEVVEFPDDLAALKFSMKNSEKGYANVETLKGFSEKETEFAIP